ncbi:MAG: hypothetical protein RJB31_2012 [Bacteroidota bacterium]
MKGKAHYLADKYNIMKLIKHLSLAVVGLLMSAMSFAQTADEIVAKHIAAIGGADNWKKINNMRQEATLSVQGMDIPVVITAVHNKATKQEYTVMGMTGYSIITSEGGWNFNPMQGQTKPEPITQDELKYGKDNLDLQGDFVDYKAKGHSIQLMDKEDIEGVECLKIKLTRKSGNESIFFFDPKTYYIVRTSSKMSANGQEVESVVNMSNYQKLPEGIVIAYTIESTAIPAPITVTKVIVNGKIDEAVFKVVTQ